MIQLLIVDDEPHVVERIANTIEWQNIGIEAVHTAFSGEEALRILSVNSIDIVITDIQMPVMDGITLIREIGNRWKSVKCILLSGYAEFKYAQAAIQQGIYDYILKPVTAANLLKIVSNAIEELRGEWEALLSQQKMKKTLHENLSLLRGNLLNELLHGRRYSEAALAEKMNLLEIPDFTEQRCILMMIRMEEMFAAYDFQNRSLMEYAIGNMAEEIFAAHFQIWHCRDAHDYSVFLLTPIRLYSQAELDVQKELQRAAAQLQSAVKNYLNGKISILLSRWGSFPHDIVRMYNSSTAAMRRRIGNEQELIMTVSSAIEQVEIQTLNSLYELPTLTQLLEAGRWEDSRQKLQHIFRELGEKKAQSYELSMEVFFSLSAAFSHITHKNGLSLSALVSDAYDKWFQENPFRSAQQMQEWFIHVLSQLQNHMEQETKDSRTLIIREVREFIETNLAKDVSLQAIADHVHLHPVYVSKIYKWETGEKLSDYVYQFRMEKAAYLLTHTAQKIYEVAEALGYQRAHSFIHVFKKHYGMTPQEYRDQRRPPIGV